MLFAVYVLAMFVHITFQSRGVVAEWALVWFVGPVDHHVSGQLRLLCEHFEADVADELFVLVYPSVLVQNTGTWNGTTETGILAFLSKITTVTLTTKKQLVYTDNK